MINAKKDEAAQKAALEAENKLNVLDINVEEDFEIDDIWITLSHMLTQFL